MLIVTNNPKIASCRVQIMIDFDNIDYGEVLEKTKNYIIKKQMILLTHPLSGSIKPNETYYKSIVLTENERKEIDLTSLEYIEKAIETYKTFMQSKMRPNWTESILNDFAYVDYYLMKSTFERMHIHCSK